MRLDPVVSNRLTGNCLAPTVTGEHNRGCSETVLLPHYRVAIYRMLVLRSKFGDYPPPQHQHEFTLEMFRPAHPNILQENQENRRLLQQRTAEIRAVSASKSRPGNPGFLQDYTGLPLSHGPFDRVDCEAGSHSPAVVKP